MNWGVEIVGLQIRSSQFKGTALFFPKMFRDQQKRWDRETIKLRKHLLNFRRNQVTVNRTPDLEKYGCLKAKRCVTGSWHYSINENVSENHFQCFRHDVGIQDLHEFVRFSVVASLTSESSFVPVDRSIATLVRLDSYVATFIPSFRADESDWVGDHRQELYNDTFSMILFIASAQIVHQIGAYVDQWCPKDVIVSSLSIERRVEFSSKTFWGRATVGMFIPCFTRHLIAISGQWCSPFIAQSMGRIHEEQILWLIAECRNGSLLNSISPSDIIIVDI